MLNLHTSRAVETLWKFEVGGWAAFHYVFFAPSRSCKLLLQHGHPLQETRLRGLFPCSSFMWFNEVSGECLSLCLLSCNSSALIAWFCLARSLTRCWTYVFVSALAEQIVLFATGSRRAADCRPGAGAAPTCTLRRLRCLFRAHLHRGADRVARPPLIGWINWASDLGETTQDVPHGDENRLFA